LRKKLNEIDLTFPLFSLRSASVALKAMLSLSKHLQNQKREIRKSFSFLHQVVDDEINARCGQQKIRLATQAPGRVWRMNQESLSPRYTTNLDEIMTLNCL
jgi:Domain of unknown function (DUF4113)